MHSQLNGENSFDIVLVIDKSREIRSLIPLSLVRL
jgi:sensor domain CHASE-containing protein